MSPTKDNRKRKPSAQSSPSANSKIKISKPDLHLKITQLEENEAKTRSSEEDGAIFKETCAVIRSKMQEVQKLKLKGKSEKTSSDVTELRTQALMQFLTLKKLNRLDKLRTKMCRETTNDAKNKVDSLHLKLQNLLYEAMHLQKEINKCQQFKSKDEDIDLVSIEQFYKEAPKEIAAPDITKKNAHLQHLKRLEYENAQRTEMNEAFKKLEKGKEALEDIIRTKSDKLSNLRPQLESILERTLPVQEYLDMPITQQKNQFNMTKYLPHPLFILYKETKAYAEACDKKLLVTIVGDEEDAKLFKNKSTVDEQEDEDDEATEESVEDDESSKKKQRGNKGLKHQMNRQEERLRNLLEIHPLKIKVKVSIDLNNTKKSKRSTNVASDDTSVQLTFSFLTKLQVIGVHVELTLGKESKGVATDREVLNSSSLLSHLLQSSDHGMQIPNLSTKYLITDIGIEELPKTTFEKVGPFYQWAQNLGGIDFISEIDRNQGHQGLIINEEICITRVKQITKAIHERVQSRLALQRQISHLEKAKLLQIDLKLPEEVVPLFPKNPPSSRIRNWTKVNWEDYVQVEITKHLVQSNMVDGQDFFFRIQINRDPATLIALIAIKPDYPKTAPIFCLNLHWRNEFNAANSERIRELEMFINCVDEHLAPSVRLEVLTIQLQKLLISLDVMLEAWNNLDEFQGKLDFKREKLFIRAVSGRNRSLPLAYNPQLDIFTP